MKKYPLLFLVFFCSLLLIGQKNMGCQFFKSKNCQTLHKSAELDTRSDSVDILHYKLFFDFWHLDGEIRANAEISIEAKVDGIGEIRLDLLELSVDSVIHNSGPLSFVNENELVTVELPSELNTGEGESFTIYYSGAPATDDAGFGGFYFSGEYAFNIGVGFAADPHNYGRSWFPCFDNFVERMSFDFTIMTDSTHNSICNGDFLSTEEISPDSLLHHWMIEEEIPSYLAAIAVGEFNPLEWEFSSIGGGDVPVILAAIQSDSANVADSFINLQSAFDTYENRYGAYQWNKVGFALVPFGSGAMEHATNVAYPKSLANGTLNFETLMAHELSHHWWGDLVTCQEAEDMWINEGFASYSEFLFLEDLYGVESYIEAVKENHIDVIKNAHESDGGRLAISGIGHENTYGDHVYNKGADVAHTMRTYLGDDYADLWTQFLDENAFQDVTSYDLRDFLETNSDADMINFFENWVFAPGFPEFGVDHYEYDENGGSFDITIDISQKLHYAPEIYENVPLKLRVIDLEYNHEDFEVLLQGESQSFEITSSLEPLFIYLNPNEEISQAVLSEQMVLTETGTQFLTDSEFRLDVEELNSGDSIWIRVEYHWVDADPANADPEYHVSDDRFWRIRSHSFDESSLVSARMDYEGNDGAPNYIDEFFFQDFEFYNLNEDSLVLVYRVDASQNWEEYSNYELNVQGSNDNWVGRFEINELITGDYAWAYRWTSESSVGENIDLEQWAYYSPLNETIVLGPTAIDNSSAVYEIIDVSGRLVQRGRIGGSGMVACRNLSKGVFIFRLIGQNDEISFIR